MMLLQLPQLQLMQQQLYAIKQQRQRAEQACDCGRTFRGPPAPDAANSAPTTSQEQKMAGAELQPSNLKPDMLPRALPLLRDL